MDLTPFGAIGVVCLVVASGGFALVWTIAGHIRDDSDVVR